MGKEPKVVSCGVNLELDDPKTGSLTKLGVSEWEVCPIRALLTCEVKDKVGIEISREDGLIGCW